MRKTDILLGYLASTHSNIPQKTKERKKSLMGDLSNLKVILKIISSNVLRCVLVHMTRSN